MPTGRANRSAIGSIDTVTALPDAAACVLATTVAASSLAVLKAMAARLPLAHPNARSLHAAPVPRVGGLAIWAGALPCAWLAPPAGIDAGAWAVGFAIVAGVSFADDWRGVRPLVRLALHAVAAVIASAGLVSALAPGASIVAAIAIVWAANLYNFMDGSDGLAALMAVFGFGSLGAAAAYSATPAGAFYAIACASLVFLAVNRPPARMFMGDVGAVPLGFLACVWSIAGARADAFPTWLPVLVFMPFWSDATATLVARVARRERVTMPHRSHHYQRLLRLGAGHGGTLACFGTLMFLTSASGLAALALSPALGWVVVVAWMAIHAALFAAIEYHWRKRSPPEQ